MSEETLYEQAIEIEQLLPKIMRRLYTVEPDHPTNELPLAQLRVCSILRTGSRTLSAISDELGISVSATTQIADRLERSGLVERIVGVDDRRMKYLRLTPLGMEIMRTRHEVRVQRTLAALRHLTPEMRHAMLEAIPSFLEAISAATLEMPISARLYTRQEQVSDAG
jgi:DNA-binding MarR family transcriptional regulator